ncbi:xanthine dehydrogenase accessory factor [Haloferula luteola]|uniref:Xanthine dehydrogenase accessory factor n=1 Tax=Haloferula luteola TaxID=595692 RepID=A0A840V0I4_9BACT|nr:xanthine dehydrogenase accessory protein XdhC [Haloferula luteola]MBB5351512.1 xanthine dehydrogenase accessory factor [Haloferula luteola]
MDVWLAIAEARKSGMPMVVVTVISARGSVPGELGGKALVSRWGLTAGNLGGGKVEARAVAHAMKMLEEGGVCESVIWNLQRDIGMTCGGEMGFLFENVAASENWSIVVFGAGHVGAALVRLLNTLRCTVDLVDPREEWLAAVPDGARLRKHRVDRFEDGVRLVRNGSFVVCVTKGHASDRPVLREVAKSGVDWSFVGVIGSASKRAVLWKELRDEGVEDAFLEKLECPLGLPIGGNDPAEIAVSIVARLLQVRG